MRESVIEFNNEQHSLLLNSRATMSERKGNDTGEQSENVVEGQPLFPFEDALMVEGEPAWDRMGKIARFCASVVKKHFGEVLDFTPESLKVLDRVILSGRGGESKGELPLKVRVAFGAYLGELLVRRTSGRWVSGLEEEEPASILFLDSNDQALASVSPFMIVGQKLANPWTFDLSLAWTALDQKLKEIGAT